LNGSVEILVKRAARESALQKIIHLIEHAQRSKAPSQRFTDRFGSGYTYGVLGLTAVMFLVWWLALGYAPFNSASGQPSAFYRAMTLLVVASPVRPGPFDPKRDSRGHRQWSTPGNPLSRRRRRGGTRRR
jgi:Cd2+/Zn2+-exporting ATPase